MILLPLIVLFGIFLNIPNTDAATLVVSNTLGDNMVLQRAPSFAVIWGWDTPASKITVSVGGKEINGTTTGADGKFYVNISHPKGGPFVITISSSSGSTVNFQNVLFGDVFLCGGQSNMVYGVAGVFNATTEVANAARYPNIRLFSVGIHTTSLKPLEQLDSIDLKWSAASPITVGNGTWTYFSAVCWFFGKNLFDQDNTVPIGLISSNWGGTIVEAWSSPDALAKCPAVSNHKNAIQDDMVHSPEAGPDANTPSVLWNAMIVPFLHTSLRAVLWYQGESNAFNPIRYRCQFPAMITDWRKNFVGASKLPFLFVQLAPWAPATNVSETRLAQLYALALPNVGFATAVDLGDASSFWGNIHPRNKQEVGRRLSLAAESIVYGRNVVWEGPMAAKATVDSQGPQVKIHVVFKDDSISGGLVLKPTPPCPVDASQCSLLKVGMSDGKQYDAAGSLDGNALVISATVGAGLTVKSFSYAWSSWPICNLYNGAGLPAIPFLFEY